MEKTHINLSDFILMPGGKTAFLRFPSRQKIEDLEPPPMGNYRLATHAELIAANRGFPYPWGYSPENTHPTVMWQKHRIGYGGLVHTAWFIVADGTRIGGAPNVLETGFAAKRHYMYLNGGNDPNHRLHDNEGYAILWEGIPRINERVYSDIHLESVATHVSMDEGGVTISPILSEEDITLIGFTGKCFNCSKPERVSIGSIKEALQKAELDWKVELHPDWKKWEYYSS